MNPAVTVTSRTGDPAALHVRAPRSQHGHGGEDPRPEIRVRTGFRTSEAIRSVAWRRTDARVGTFAGTFLVIAVGVAMVLAAPWVTRAVTSLDRWLLRSLLGPGKLAERVRHPETTPAQVVDDSAATLRRTSPSMCRPEPSKTAPPGSIHTSGPGHRIGEEAVAGVSPRQRTRFDQVRPRTPIDQVP
jgi:hypothetical protein